MTHTISDYMALMNTLRAMGQELMAKDENWDNDWMDEVETMDMHLECAMNILSDLMD